MSDKNKKKQIAKITVFITSIFVIFLSVTYAFINLTLFGNKRQIITVGNLQLRLEEKNEIKLENAFPMYDEVGMIQPSFNFQLINETNMNIKYILKLEDITEEDANRLNNSIVRYGLVKDKNEPIIDSLSTIAGNDYKLEEATIPKKTTIDFQLRLWINHEVTDNKEISGKSLKYRIGVEAEQGKKYVVDFDTKDPSITVEGGGTYGTLPSPTKAGYKFNGWYTEEEGEGKKIESDTKFEAKEDQTLYAYFEKLPNAPELGNSLIPVTYNKESKQWQVADASNPNEEWYNYDKQEWANAVTLDHTKVLDLSGENNHGKISGSILKNNEVSLDGIDDYIDCGLADYEFGTTFSTVVRFKIESFPTSEEGKIISNTEVGGIAIVITTDKKLKCYIYDKTKENYSYKTVETPLEVNYWYEVAMTFNGSKMDIYLNGELADTETFDTPFDMQVSSKNFILGAEPLANDGMTGEFSNITVSKAQIYKRILTATDVSTIYSEGKLKDKNNLLVDYDFKMDKTMESGTLLPMDMISTMFVWIPRYSYTIKSEEGEIYFGKQEDGRNTVPSSDLPGEIDVHFIAKNTLEKGSAKYTTTKGDSWRTPDGFTFDNKQLSGIWVGKFELAGNLISACTDATCDISSLTIKPNVTSLTNQKVSSFFYAIKSMQKLKNPFGFETDQNKVDIHMMKNSEWGITAYLSQSKYGKYGNKDYDETEKQIKINNCSNFKTGIGASTQNAEGTTDTCENQENQYNSSNGQAASTTGNITGVYDMNGGAWDYVMGNLNKIAYSSGFQEGLTGLDAKYYDLYKTEDITTTCDGTCYGHALSETSEWYNDYADFVSSSKSWFLRGGGYHWTSDAGVFNFSSSDGDSKINYSSRVVLISF